MPKFDFTLRILFKLFYRLHHKPQPHENLKKYSRKISVHATPSIEIFFFSILKKKEIKRRGYDYGV